jgi:hypothetical protein
VTIPRLTAVAGVLLLGVSLFAQGPRRDGQWEIKMEMQMAGMTMPGQTVTQCITPDQAKDPQKALPPTGRGGRGGDDCKISDYKVDGNKVTWSMTCERQKMSGTGEFVYAGETYTGTMKMNAQGQDMTMKMTGKRLGDCTQ